MYNYHWYDIVSTWPIVEYALKNSSDYHMVLLIPVSFVFLEIPIIDIDKA